MAGTNCWKSPTASHQAIRPPVGISSFCEHYQDNEATGSRALAGSGVPRSRQDDESPSSDCAPTMICYPSQSTFHSPRNLLLAQPNRSCDANTPSAIVFLLSISVSNASPSLRFFASRCREWNMLNATYRRICPGGRHSAFIGHLWQSCWRATY